MTTKFSYSKTLYSKWKPKYVFSLEMSWLNQSRFSEAFFGPYESALSLGMVWAFADGSFKIALRLSFKIAEHSFDFIKAWTGTRFPVHNRFNQVLQTTSQLRGVTH